MILATRVFCTKILPRIRSAMSAFMLYALPPDAWMTVFRVGCARTGTDDGAVGMGSGVVVVVVEVVLLLLAAVVLLWLLLVRRLAVEEKRR